MILLRQINTTYRRYFPEEYITILDIGEASCKLYSQASCNVSRNSVIEYCLQLVRITPALPYQHEGVFLKDKQQLGFKLLLLIEKIKLIWWKVC